jgi:hypothetical protein
MPTLGTQTIQNSYTQLLKTDGLGGIDATLQAITDGANTASALELSSAGVRSTGTLNVAGATTLASSLVVTGAATFSSSLGVTGVGTIGTLQVGASGPKLTAVSFGTAAFTSATVSQHNSADATTGSFGLTGVALGDMIIGSLNSLGSATGTVNIGLSLYPAATNFVKYSIQNQGSTAGTIPDGIFFATALRFTA